MAKLPCVWCIYTCMKVNARWLSWKSRSNMEDEYMAQIVQIKWRINVWLSYYVCLYVHTCKSECILYMAKWKNMSKMEDDCIA